MVFALDLLYVAMAIQNMIATNFYCSSIVHLLVVLMNWPTHEGVSSVPFIIMNMGLNAALLIAQTKGLGNTSLSGTPRRMV
jgi:hypothetical protein